MMKYFTHTNAGKLKLNFRTKMNLLTTGLIFVLLLLSTFLGNGVMILLIHHGFINAGPPSSQIPLLIQTVMKSSKPLSISICGCLKRFDSGLRH